ncbi:MAG: superoxide dismutase, Ni [Chloroflexi bacterium]|nr:superoxide dismutase, Ni [Chloroflexota bacterium]
MRFTPVKRLLSHGLRRLDEVVPPEVVHAHCDIPCGIYNPVSAEIAADTVIKMTQLLLDLGPQPQDAAASLAWHNSASRYILVKEEHGRKLKEEVLILWTDYFKPEHAQKYPELHELVWQTCKLASRAKQNIDPEAAKQVRQKVARIAEIFWETKK